MPPPPEPSAPIERDYLSRGCGGGDLPNQEFARPLDDEVLRLYNAAFGRPPDSNGQRYSINIRGAGNGQLAVAAEFTVSPEWEIRYGASPTHQQVVDRFYSNVLGRAPDAGGRANWLQLLESGQITVPQMLVQFADSQENINQTQTSQVQIREDGAICRLYLVVLQQLPDKAALEHWRHQLRAGITLEEIAEVLMDTDRYDAVYRQDLTPFELVYSVSCVVIGDVVDAEVNIFFKTWLSEFESKQHTIAGLLAAISQGQDAVIRSGTTPPA